MVKVFCIRSEGGCFGEGLMHQERGKVGVREGCCCEGLVSGVRGECCIRSERRVLW